MRLRRFLWFLLLALLIACTETDTPQVRTQAKLSPTEYPFVCPVEVAPGVFADIEVQIDTVLGTTGPGSDFLFVRPVSNWNGDVVFFNHGYVDPAVPAGFPDTFPEFLAFLADFDESGQLRGILCGLVLGTPEHGSYAVGVSAFPKYGFAVKEGAQRTHQLFGLFKSVFGLPDHVYVMGSSMGGAISAYMAEKYPDEIDGVLAMCGFVGGTKKQLDYIGDVRNVFDVLYPGVLPGSAADVPEDLAFDIARVLVLDALLADPAYALQNALLFAGLDQTHLPLRADVAESFVESLLPALFYNVAGTNDLLALTHGHNPYDNTATVYSDSVANPFNPTPPLPPVPAGALDALNFGIDRFAGDPAALDYIGNYFEPTGQIGPLVVTLHNTGDPDVPFSHEATYFEIVFDAGAPYSGRLVQWYVDSYGHCNFTPQQIGQAFFGLVGWVEYGVAPLGGELD